MDSHILQTGGSLKADEHCIICSFPTPRLVLSTSLYNGGYIMATHVFNHRLKMFVNSEQDLPGGSTEKYLALVAGEHDLNQESATGLLTSARMHCRGYSNLTFNDITVEVIATAGVDENAVRAGDPASYYEDNDGYQPVGGTINILALTNISLSHGAMAKALLSITEAKTAALQELAVISPFTLQPATGTGTDGVILACDPASSRVCTDTGTQSKLGELFCRATKAAIKQSLALECAIEPGHQSTLHERLRRLDIAPEYNSDLATESPQAKILLAMSQSVWQEYCWQLITIDELAHFFTFLENSAPQPLGSRLAAMLRQKIPAINETAE